MVDGCADNVGTRNCNTLEFADVYRGTEVSFVPLQTTITPWLAALLRICIVSGSSLASSNKYILLGPKISI